MAYATIECTCRRCGKAFEVRKERRNRKAADEWVSWATSVNAYDLCTDCWKIEQAEAAAAKNKERGLPELTGSPKQIAWANKIRDQFCDAIKHHCDSVRESNVAHGADCTPLDQAEQEGWEIIRSMTEARSWIDIRTELPIYWLSGKLIEKHPEWK